MTDTKSEITAADSLFDDDLSADSDDGQVVRFGSVRVHTHKRVLGDHPSVSDGPPISLDWNPCSSERYTLDEFEKLHGNDIKKAVRLSRDTREMWLQDNGHTQRSFDRISDEIDEIKASRLETKREAAMSQLTPMEEYKLMVNLSYKDYKRRRGSMSSQTSEGSGKGKLSNHGEPAKPKRFNFFSRFRRSHTKASAL